ncbi:hypothetical protein MalM25_16580 [Planctomycetes bacterium MalM25]|nr:hypothetical protein MalM25_16580 [Planctomycetes bacterium MalM25]
MTLARFMLPIATAIVALTAVAEGAPRYGRDIRPILSDKCFHCHGPDAQTREAGVRLDVPHEIDLGEVVLRIESDEEGYRMPPLESHKAITAEQAASIKAWIDDGAPYEQHWSFQPLVVQEIPEGDDAWASTPIDQFVASRHRAEGLCPSPKADRRTLIRRVTLDLTGLPPNPKEVAGFVHDDAPGAYARLVDRLLASDRYGEHMARYWLDLVRYADTNGLHHDHYRQMAPYRDWVIRAFNEDLPYEDFVSWQLAGDLYDHPTTDQLIASGFNRLHLVIDVGTALPEESFNRNVIDRVSAFGTAMLGLTLECAVCHDHKYDPISQKDFYQLYGFFNNLDGESETGHRKGSDFLRGLHSPYLELPNRSQQAEIERLTGEIEASRAEIDASQPVSKVADAAPVVPDRLRGRIESLQDELASVRRGVPAALIMKERVKQRPAHVLIRGAYDQPGERVERGTPSFLPELKATGGLKTRRDLAEWLVDPTHPLTARVAVNRFWQQFMGVGLVKTSEDFGAQGDPPSHPELLDYLATRFVEYGWRVKSLVREIVLSQTYRQTSHTTPSAYRNDPENRLLSRGSRFRLDAEVIRDQALALAGLLSFRNDGASVMPPQPAGLWETVTMPTSYPRVYKADRGERAHRRSLYTFWRRSIPPPQFSIFDAPTREGCIARRERTNTPLQALVLMNEPQQIEAALAMAAAVLADPTMDDAQRLDRLVERVTARKIGRHELAKLRDSLVSFRTLYRNDPDAARAFVGGDGSTDAGEQAAWALIAHSLLNLDETRSRP